MAVRPVELFKKINAIFESNICLQLIPTVLCYHMGVGDSKVEKGKKPNFIFTHHKRLKWITSIILCTVTVQRIMDIPALYIRILCSKLLPPPLLLQSALLCMYFSPSDFLGTWLMWHGRFVPWLWLSWYIQFDFPHFLYFVSILKLFFLKFDDFWHVLSSLYLLNTETLFFFLVYLYFVLHMWKELLLKFNFHQTAIKYVWHLCSLKDWLVKLQDMGPLLSENWFQTLCSFNTAKSFGLWTLRWSLSCCKQLLLLKIKSQ